MPQRLKTATFLHFRREVDHSPFTFGVMLCVMQNCRCVRMLSMLWKACCRVVLRYFCIARAMGANIAWAASRGSMISLGCLGDEVTSSSLRRLMCVKASSTATTNLPEGGEALAPKHQTWSHSLMVYANMPFHAANDKISLNFKLYYSVIFNWV